MDDWVARLAYKQINACMKGEKNILARKDKISTWIIHKVCYKIIINSNQNF